VLATTERFVFSLLGIWESRFIRPVNRIVLQLPPWVIWELRRQAPTLPLPILPKRSL
jgi:hypothetical protein